MAYCGPRGLPLDTFLTWPRRSQNAALEWQAHESRRCSNDGTHPDDWAEDRHAHHAHLSDQCPGCLMKHRRTEAAGKDGLPPGVQVVLARGPAVDCPRCRPRD